MVVGLGFTIRQLALTTHQLDMLKKTNIDLHDWNRRKAAQKAIDDMVPRIASDTPLLDHTFHILTNNGATIPLETIEKACENNKSVRLAIHQRLNCFESLASGVLGLPRLHGLCLPLSHGTSSQSNLLVI